MNTKQIKKLEEKLRLLWFNGFTLPEHERKLVNERMC